MSFKLSIISLLSLHPLFSATSNLKMKSVFILGALVAFGSALPQTAGVEKRTNGACSPQPHRSGPIPSPDTASSFLNHPEFAASASAAPVPSGYTHTFTNLKASSQENGYIGSTILSSYNSVECAAACNSRVGCSAFNIFFERGPSIVSCHQVIEFLSSNHISGTCSSLPGPR